MCEKVWITLSGGTTGLSLSMSVSSFAESMTCPVRDKVEFMMRECGEREKK
jgi:hypothetical protein